MIVVNIIENLMITVIIGDMEVNWVVKVMKGSMVYMTERFRLGYVCGDYGLIDNDEWIDLHSMSENSEKNVQICINKMNELAEENELIKQENKELKHENVKIMSDLDYFRTKNGSLEEGLFKQDREIAKLEKENRELNNRLNKYIVDYNGLNCEWHWLKTENEQIKKDLKIILPLILAIDFIKMSINECKAVNRLCKLVEDDFIKSKEIIYKKKEYPKRNPITYAAVPEAIYNWND